MLDLKVDLFIIRLEYVRTAELLFLALPEIRWLPDGYTVWYKRDINCMVTTVKYVHFYLVLVLVLA